MSRPSPAVMLFRVVRDTAFRARRYGLRSAWNCLRTPFMNEGLRWRNRFGRPRVECPCCGWRGAAFLWLDIGQWVLPQLECPRCGRHDRHRLMRLVMNTPAAAQLFKDACVLHCAPDPEMREWMDRLGARFVVSGDLDPFMYTQAPPPKTAADLTALPFKDCVFDVVAHVHVLEHILDDRAALREIRRVLRPGGAALMMVPFAPIPATVEYGKPNPELYGHVRDYSANDFPEKLKDFEVTAFRADEFLERSARERYQIRPDETVFLCRKQAEQH